MPSHSSHAWLPCHLSIGNLVELLLQLEILRVSPPLDKHGRFQPWIEIFFSLNCDG